MHFTFNGTYIEHHGLLALIAMEKAMYTNIYSENKSVDIVMYAHRLPRQDQ